MMQNIMNSIHQAIQQAHGAAAAGASGILMGPFMQSSSTTTTTRVANSPSTSNPPLASTNGTNLSPLANNPPPPPPRSAGLRGMRQTHELLNTINGDLQSLIDQMTPLHESVQGLSTGSQPDSNSTPTLALQFHQMLGLLQTLFASLISYSARLGSRVSAGEPLTVAGMAEMNMFVIGLRRLRLLLFSLISVCEMISVNTAAQRIIPPANVYLSGAIQGPSTSPPPLDQREAAAQTTVNPIWRLIQQDLPVSSLLRGYQPAAEALQGITVGQLLSAFAPGEDSTALKAALARFVTAQMGDDKVSVMIEFCFICIVIDCCKFALTTLHASRRCL